MKTFKEMLSYYVLKYLLYIKYNITKNMKLKLLNVSRERIVSMQKDIDIIT